MFAEQAQISNDLLKNFSINHRRHKGIIIRPALVDKGIFDYTEEKYEANSKGLLKFRAPSPEEKTILTTLPPPGRVDVVPLPQTNPPPPVEYVDDGLKDLGEIGAAWDAFKEAHNNITCEKLSNTEFKVSFLSPD